MCQKPVDKVKWMLAVCSLWSLTSDGHPVVSCRDRDVCVGPGWLCNSLTPGWPWALKPQRKARHLAQFGNFLWADVSEHLAITFWLFHSCTKKRCKKSGLCAILKPSGWLGTHPAKPAQNRNVSDSHFTFLFCIPGCTHRSSCQKAHLGRKMKNWEQEVGEAFYGMAFSPLFLKGFFLQFVSVWVRSVC